MLELGSPEKEPGNSEFPGKFPANKSAVLKVETHEEPHLMHYKSKYMVILMDPVYTFYIYRFNVHKHKYYIHLKIPTYM